MACAVIAQEALHKFFGVRIFPPGTSNSKPLGNSVVSLIQTFQSRGLYPNGRELLVLLP